MTAPFPIPFGRYTLVERLAIGGMAELYLADVKGDHDFAKRVVIKRILPHLASDPNFTQMFIAEAKITARLAHPRIAQTFRLGREDGQLFIEMEYIDGLDVLAVLRECAHRRVRLPPEVSTYVVKEVLDGLDYAHRLKDEQGKALGIVHRDISPSNVLISRRGNVKLVDFGIAHAAAMEQHTQAGTLKGKYGYMSPEQVLGEGVTPGSDVFSVGVVMAEMLMGRRLFAAPNELDVLLMVRDVNLGRLERYGGHIPADLDALMKRALKKDPAERFTSAAEMRDALDEWMFQNRMRVTPAIVGELVDSLYEDAHERRRAGLDDAPPPLAQAEGLPQVIAAAAERSGALRMSDPARAATMPPPMRVVSGPPAGTPSIVPSPVAPPPAAPPAHAHARAKTEQEDALEGIPIGRSQILGGGESLSEEEIELAFAGALSGLDEERRTQKLGSLMRETGKGKAIDRRQTGKEPAPERRGTGKSPVLDDDLSLSEEIVVDLEGMNGVLPPARYVPPSLDGEESGERTMESRYPPHMTQAEVAGPAAFGMEDDGIPISVEDPEHSMRFPTISAAVASVSPPKRDPASRDFDDSDVSGIAEPVDDARSGRVRLPTADELARAPRPAPPALEEINETAAQQGDLSVTSPIRVLFQLVASRADGMLTVSLGGIRKEIYIKDGMPTYVSSNVASELFGSYLVNEGAISSGELDMALAMMPHFSGKLGDTLVGLGLMKPLDVFRLLTRQVRHKLIDVSTWSKGTYRWYPWRENHRESFPLDLDPYEVLGAGAMALDGDRLTAWMEQRMTMRPKAVERPNVRPEQFKIGKVARDVLEELNGERTMTELISRRSSADDRLSFLRVLFLFLETGLVLDGAARP